MSQHGRAKEAEHQARQSERVHLWLKGQSLEDSANLSDPDVIAAEIAKDLEDAPLQFSQIAADLKK